MPSWTEDQQKTIDTRDKNILVSAAAGSGKTTVLVERIKKLILEGQTDVDRFLITTFTKAAAGEMRQRLEAAIRKELESSTEPADRAFLLRQLQLLPGSAIGTFHSFAIDLIRQYFYLTDLEPGFGIIDDVRQAILKKDAMDQVFERRYEEGSDDFYGFLKRHSSDRNDNRLKESLIHLYDSLRSIPFYMDWAKEKTRCMKDDNPAGAMGLLQYIAEETEQELRRAFAYYEKAAQVLDSPYCQDMYSKAAEDAARVKAAIESAGDFEQVQQFFRQSFNQMRAKKQEKEAYEAVKEQVSGLRKQGKDILDKLKERYYLRSIDDYNAEINAVYPDTAFLVDLIAEFEQVYKQAKTEENVIDMDDVMHYAIGVLGDERAAREQQERFTYIFVDKYQDSNLLQEAIVGRIARTNNLFMVGDVKQSIYKFRLAEPEIFTDKAKRYRSDAVPESMVIDLNSNFRSKSNVTETVNAVFRPVLPEYDEHAQLHCMAPEDQPGYKTGLHIIDRKSLETDDIERGELEAEVVADIIRDALGREIFDTKKNQYRPVEYRDIAVLARAGSTVAELEHYLNNEGIPSYGDTGEGYFETVEIQVFINLLKVIDNMRQDVPLISVMRSAIFDFSVRDMALIRIHYQDGSFCSAFRAYLENGPDRELRGKLAEMDRRISVWKETGRTVPLEELVRMLLYDTGYFDYCSGLPVGKQRISNLQLIVEKAAVFEKSNHSGLNGFLRYIQAMADSKTSEAEAKTISESENVVRVMTVHKSKGLEFPVVIFTGAGKQVSGGNRNAAPMHKAFGIGLPLVNKEEHWKKKTLLQNAIAAKQAAENLEESVRILYVALTRAMDRLEIVGSVKNPDELNDVVGMRSYLDMMYASLKDRPEVEVHLYDQREEPEETEDIHRQKAKALLELAEREGGSVGRAVTDEIDRRLRFVYETSADVPVKLKYSVTELNKAGQPAGEATGSISVAEFEPEQAHRLTAAEAGTIMHMIMEHIDFVRARDEGEAYIDAFADELLRQEAITEEERQAVRSDRIAKFFEQEIGRQAAEAFARGKLEREKEFIMEKEIGGERAVVQGIIDCWFEGDDGPVLIDYKNSHLGWGRSVEDIVDTYRGQIQIYKEALEGALGRKVAASYLFLFDLGKFTEIP